MSLQVYAERVLWVKLGCSVQSKCTIPKSQQETWASSKLIGWSNSSHEVETEKKKNNIILKTHKSTQKKTAMQTSPNDSRICSLTRRPDVSTLRYLKILLWFFSGSNHLQVCGVEEFNCRGSDEILWSSLRFNFCLSAWIIVARDGETLIWSLLNFHIWNASSGIDQLLLFLPPIYFAAHALEERRFISFHIFLLWNLVALVLLKLNEWASSFLQDWTLA